MGGVGRRSAGRPESSIYGEAGAAFHLCITNTAAIDRRLAQSR
jgi:hypothetical protein